METALIHFGSETGLERDLHACLLHNGLDAVSVQGMTGFEQIARTCVLRSIILLSGCFDSVVVSEILGRIGDLTPGVPVILITSKSSEDLAIEALKLGVKDYFKPPLSCEEVAVSIRQYLVRPALWKQNQRALESIDSRASQEILGSSPVMRRLAEYLLKAAAVDSNVLITGETGTGKELVARMIHKNSLRHAKPFLSINCAAIPDSLLESELFGHEKGAFTGAHKSYAGKLKLAEGGSVFLDEIGDISAYAQAKILRVIENKEVHRLGAECSIQADVRFIGATNQDLEKLVAENCFRKDLYYRLNVARINLPPLRDRKEDLRELSDHFVRQLNQKYNQRIDGFTKEAWECLYRYDWPGNIRELKNLLETIFIDCPAEHIAMANLPVDIVRKLQHGNDPTLVEQQQLIETLLSTNWNKSCAARQLHWSRMTLYRKMMKYHILESSQSKIVRTQTK